MTTFSKSDLWFSLPDEFCQEAIIIDIGYSRIKGLQMQKYFWAYDYDDYRY